MAQTCTRCSRPNPPDASYCYFDGSVLAGHQGNGAASALLNTGTQPFPSQFVFPTGQVCRNFDQLALACQENWKAAEDLLQQGYLETFLGGLGRSDLALAAREAARFPDRGRGLDQLLAKLPSEAVAPPKLDVLPKEISLGQLKVGEDRQLDLHLNNQGMRLLYGTVSCDDCPWLTVGEGTGSPQKLFQFSDELVLPVHVRGKQLRAGNKPLEGRLVVESNGGIATVVVRADVPIRPYPDGILAGARSPRQIAEKAKTSPKDAAPFFEKGAVARWYESNGWKYPVQGPSASGLGAVQQFFEALGLTPPPKVQINQRSVALQGNAGDQVTHTLEVSTPEKRPVYAHGASDQPWLEVGRARLNGRMATIPLVISSVPDRSGETLRAKVTVTANGNQRFIIPVELTVGGSFNFFEGAAAKDTVKVTEPTAVAALAPVRPTTRPPAAAARGAGPKSRSWHWVPAALLLLGLVAIVIWDLSSPHPAQQGSPVAAGGSKFSLNDLLDRDPRIGIQFNDDNQRFGILMLKEKDPNNPDRAKRLTYDESGNSNNTCIQIDGSYYLFGNPRGQGHWAVENNKRQRHIEVKDRDGNVLGWKSVWDYDQHIRVTQTVYRLPGEQSRVLDTCLVTYEIENMADVAHKVGIRVMIDTYIGANDGVPFAIPGQKGLLETWRRFSQKEIPDYIEALEHPDLKNPGTVARMGLKLPMPNLEPIESMLICRWPGNSEILWDWTPQAMNDPPDQPKDSCVTLYWAYRVMNPHEKRQMAFTYGLGSISTTPGGGKGRLALSAGGSFRPGGDFTVTAYVQSPKAGQKITLDLPAGLSFAGQQEATQDVQPEPGKDYTQLSWRVHADKAGEYVLKADLVGEATEQLKVQIREGSIFD